MGQRDGVCPPCRETLEESRLDPANRCPICFHERQEDAECEICSSRDIFFDDHRSLYGLSSGWHRVLRNWKFHNQRAHFRLFLPAFHQELDRWKDRGPVHLAFIGSGRSGRDLRAFQPCEDLCNSGRSRLLESSSAGSLQKKKKRKQSGASYSDRFYSVYESFSTKPLPYGRPVLLIEDLYTTGATSNEAARVLKKAGAPSVHVISMLFHDRRE